MRSQNIARGNMMAGHEDCAGNVVSPADVNGHDDISLEDVPLALEIASSENSS